MNSCVRGNQFYVAQRYRTPSIPNVDCHKDLHRSVRNACSHQRKSLCSILVFLPDS